MPRRAVGSVLNMTPASGTVHFTQGDERWTLPLIGWAVVVVDSTDGETEIQPVVLEDDAYPELLPEYRRGYVAGSGQQIQCRVALGAVSDG